MTRTRLPGAVRERRDVDDASRSRLWRLTRSHRVPFRVGYLGSKEVVSRHDYSVKLLSHQRSQRGLPRAAPAIDRNQQWSTAITNETANLRHDHGYCVGETGGNGRRHDPTIVSVDRRQRFWACNGAER
jgi:hypothetical protein